MRRIELDFRRTWRPSRWPGVLLLAAALGSAALIGEQYRRIGAETDAIAEAVRNFKVASQRKARAPRPAGDPQTVAVELKRAGEIATHLRLPWGTLFQSIESAKLPEVALLAVESDTARHRVKISAEAKSAEAMLDYLRFLGGLQTLSGVYLESHSVQQQDPQHPVRFAVSAEWVPDAASPQAEAPMQITQSN